jgi:2,4-dienoyl-CoA reductase-like NADH-dependent reductase (Old Yellow Enzyme family)
MTGILFSGIALGTLQARNRLVRSATYEGLADSDGVVGADYRRLYTELARYGTGLLITGFLFVSRSGRSMQPRQAGLDNDKHIPALRAMTEAVHDFDTPVIAQLAHAGRQSLSSVTGQPLLSSTKRPSVYFRQRTMQTDAATVRCIVRDFTVAASRAIEAGFDGVQLHAAHGYLIHQFLLKETNRLTNEYGIQGQHGLGLRLLDEIIDGIRRSCGPDYPVLVKISGDTEISDAFYPRRFDALVEWLHGKGIAGMEISHGSMDYALNIFRGAFPLDLVMKHNPLFNQPSVWRSAMLRAFLRFRIRPRLLPFSPAYNLSYAARAKSLTDIPVISVGGFRSKSIMESALRDGKADMIAMSRPFIHEPRLASILRDAQETYTSTCRNCNRCVILCDSGRPTACYSPNHNTTDIHKDYDHATHNFETGRANDL